MFPITWYIDPVGCLSTLILNITIARVYDIYPRLSLLTNGLVTVTTWFDVSTHIKVDLGIL